MSNTYYSGTPIKQRDFQKEFEKELEKLTDTVSELKVKKYTNQEINYRYWAVKLSKANKALEVGTVHFAQTDR